MLSKCPAARLGEKAVISPDNKLLWDVSVEWARWPKEHSIFQQKKMPPLTKTNKKVAVLNHPAAYNYYHWMLEVLARIHLLQESRLAIDKYIINHRALPFQLETHALCGITPEKIIRPSESFHLQAKELIVPSYVNLPNLWSVNYVRKIFLSGKNKPPESKGKRIYIKRQSSRKVGLPLPDVRLSKIILYSCGLVSIKSSVAVRGSSQLVSSTIIMQPLLK